MAYQGITTETGVADSLFQGALKINNNFQDIYNTLGDGTNLSISANIINNNFQDIYNTLGDGTNLYLNISEKITILPSGNVANLSFNSVGGNLVYVANPTGPITLNITNIPTTNFDNRSLTFSVIVNQSSVAYACSSITFNGTSKTIKWSNGTVSAGNTNCVDVFNFIGINTVGSGNNVNNYTIIANLNGRYQ